MNRIWCRTFAVMFVAAALIGVQAMAEEPAGTAPEKSTPPAAATAGGPAAPMVGSIKIVFDGKAKNNGEVHVIFTPAGGEAKDVVTLVQKGMKNKAVCRDVAKNLSVVLTGLPYTAVAYDPDKIKVNGKGDAKFSLSLGAMTIKGLTIELK